VEWVETTGRTIEEAKEVALDQLGVDSKDLEFEVLEEPKVGLFGRTRGTARVRARVVPRTPRPKTERRRRPKKDDQAGGRASNTEGSTPDAAPEKSEGGSNGGRTSKLQPARSPERAQPQKEREMMDADEQAEVLRTFLEGLAVNFGLQATVEVSVDEDDLIANLEGEGLGLMVGPRMATLDAIQEIARNTLQRHAAGREYARVVVDVQGIRRRRRDALVEFVTQAASQVREDQVAVVFDVMSSADRKVVHDVAGDLDGVVSVSEGEDPRRRVVLRRA
jgi:spoIIIJ-associated protein